MPQRTLVFLVVLLAVALAAFWWSQEWLSLAWLKSHRDDLIGFCQANMALSVVAYLGVFVLCAALSVPGAASTLTLAGGMVFGLPLGIVLATLAATLGGTCAFLIARHLLHDWVHARFAAAFAIIDRGIARDGAFYLFMMRLVIVFPFFVVNPVMGLTDMPVRTFMLASFLGMLANAFVWVNAGTMLAKMSSLDDVLSMEMVLALALLGTLPLLVRTLARVMLRRDK
jgi:uncharacterized membrane protein YdjX (TVP38/TMEM64 family)